jgi:hypothetical protein
LSIIIFELETAKINFLKPKKCGSIFGKWIVEIVDEGIKKKKIWFFAPSELWIFLIWENWMSFYVFIAGWLSFLLRVVHSNKDPRRRPLKSSSA